MRCRKKSDEEMKFVEGKIAEDVDFSVDASVGKKDTKKIKYTDKL